MTAAMGHLIRLVHLGQRYSTPPKGRSDGSFPWLNLGCDPETAHEGLYNSWESHLKLVLMGCLNCLNRGIHNFHVTTLSPTNWQGADDWIELCTLINYLEGSVCCVVQHATNSWWVGGLCWSYQCNRLYAEFACTIHAHIKPTYLHSCKEMLPTLM